jgi:hypothetical protein
MGANLIRCRHCGEVIGVYEPLVAVEGESSRESSLAREPSLASAPTAHYHRNCHQQLFPRAWAAHRLDP